MSLKRLLLLASLTLPAAASAQDQESVGLSSLPPISPDYKARIVDWARFFFPSVQALRGGRLSDPVLIRDGTGRLLWLVCAETENLAPGARPGPTRYAFGFQGSYFTAPRQRFLSPLINQACDEQPLRYRPFPELGRG